MLNTPKPSHAVYWTNLDSTHKPKLPLISKPRDEVETWVNNLYQAAIEGNEDKVSELLSNAPNSSVLPKIRWTATTWIYLLNLPNGHGGSIALKLVTAETVESSNELMKHAALYGHTTLVKLMLKQRFSGKDEAFVYACCGGHWHIASSLLDKGANKYATTGYYNAVYFAARGGHFHVLLELNIIWTSKKVIRKDVPDFAGFLVEGLNDGLKYDHLKLPAELHLSHYQLRDTKALHVFLSALPHHPQITAIYLINNQLGTNTGNILREILSLSMNLQILDVSHNHLGGSNRFQHSGITLLAPGLARNKTVQKLNLSNNGINDSDVYYLANELVTNRGLLELDLSHNRLTKAAVPILISLLDTKIPLTTISIEGNDDIPKEEAERLAERLAQRNYYRQKPNQPQNADTSLNTSSQTQHPAETDSQLHTIQTQVSFQLSMYWLAIQLLNTKLIESGNKQREESTHHVKLLGSLALLIPHAGHMSHGIKGLAESLWVNLKELIENTHLIEFLLEVPLLHGLIEKLIAYGEHWGEISEEKQIESITKAFENLQDCEKQCARWLQHLTFIYADQLRLVRFEDVENVKAYILDLSLIYLRLGLYERDPYSTPEEQFVSWIFFASHYLTDSKTPRIIYQGRPLPISHLFSKPGLRCEGSGLDENAQQVTGTVYMDLLLKDETAHTNNIPAVIATNHMVAGYRHALSLEVQECQKAASRKLPKTKSNVPATVSNDTVTEPSVTKEKNAESNPIRIDVTFINSRTDAWLNSTTRLTTYKNPLDSQPELSSAEQSERILPLQKAVDVVLGQFEELKTEQKKNKQEITKLNERVETLEKNNSDLHDKNKKLRKQLEILNTEMKEKNSENEERLKALEALVFNPSISSTHVHNNSALMQTAPPTQIPSIQTSESDLPLQIPQVDTEENISDTSSQAKQRIDSAEHIPRFSRVFSGSGQQNAPTPSTQNNSSFNNEEDVNIFTVPFKTAAKNVMQ